MSKTTEIRLKVAELLSSGAKKSETFARLKRQGVDDVVLAYFIVAYPDPERCAKHRAPVVALVLLMLIGVGIVLFGAINHAATVGLGTALATGIIFAAIPLLFALGFYSNRVAAYNAYLLLSVLQFLFARLLQDLLENSIRVSMYFSFVFFTALLVWYVREKIFPGFAFMGAKKEKGKYVFAD